MELEQLRNGTRDQEKEVERLQASLVAQQQETTQLKAELQKSKKSLDETALAREKEQVRGLEFIVATLITVIVFFIV